MDIIDEFMAFGYLFIYIYWLLKSRLEINRREANPPANPSLSTHKVKLIKIRILFSVCRSLFSSCDVHSIFERFKKFHFDVHQSMKMF
jgi:hypothetical protein